MTLAAIIVIGAEAVLMLLLLWRLGNWQQQFVKAHKEQQLIHESHIQLQARLEYLMNRLPDFEEPL